MSSGQIINNPIFYYYGIMPELEVHIDGCGDTSLMFTADFKSPDAFGKFVNDLERVQEINTESRIREKNPVLQRAYEDYQILLKLSK